MMFVNLMPRTIPPVSTGVQGGEKGVGLSKDSDHRKVLGKVISTQILTSFLAFSTTTSTTTTLKPLTKGVVIEPTTEENKLALEQEIEKQRKIQSILRQRENDPTSIDKGDPSKYYIYETIEASVFSGVMHEFAKVPKKSFGI